MKILTKLFSLITIVSLTFVLCFANVQAAEITVGTTYTDQLGTTSFTPTSIEEQQIGGMTFYDIQGTTDDARFHSGTQHICYYEMKTDGVNSKLVSWAKNSSSKCYTLSSLTNLAKDYEATHPGWIVTGGVNGEMFVMYVDSDVDDDDVGQSYYYFRNIGYYVANFDNETRQPSACTGMYNTQFLGINNDGSTRPFVDCSAPKGLRVELIDDDGNILYWKDIDNFNKAAGDGEVSVWTSYHVQGSESNYVEFDVSTSKSLIMIEEPELAYVYDTSAWSNSTAEKIGIEGFFGRGTVTQVTNSYHFGGMGNNPDTYTKLNGFGIETDDQELIDKLAVGCRVRVEYYYDNELDDCECMISYHSCQEYDGVDQDTEHTDYDKNRYSRSIWGRKADGTYILMHVAIRRPEKYSGATQTELHAILRSLGVVEAYQQDGGGSAMAIVRNASGGFDLVGPSNDSSTATCQRAIFSANFFVTRDPGIEYSAKDSTFHSLTFTKKDGFDYSNCTKLSVTIDGKTYEMTGDTLTIDGLKPSTTYTAHMESVIDGETITYEVDITTKDFEFTSNMIICTEVGKSTATFQVKDSHVTSVEFNINDQVYNMENGYINVKDLNPEQEYTYSYTLKYDLPEYDLSLTYQSIEETIKTKAYDVPKITSIDLGEQKNGDVEVLMTVSDPDKLTTKVCAYLNGAVYEELSIKKSGNYSFTFEGLDVENEDYEYYFVIDYTYEPDEGDPISGTLTSDKVQTTHVETPVEPEPAKKDCNSGALMLVLSSIAAASALGFIFRKHR